MLDTRTEDWFVDIISGLEGEREMVHGFSLVCESFIPLRCRQYGFLNNQSPDFSGFFLPVAYTRSPCRRKDSLV